MKIMIQAMLEKALSRMNYKGLIMIIKRKSIVTLNILYWMPDHKNILQEFIWQTKDVKPEYPRVHKFLNFWHDNIDAVISEVMLCDEYETSYRPVMEFYNG